MKDMIKKGASVCITNNNIKFNLFCKILFSLGIINYISLWPSLNLSYVPHLDPLILQVLYVVEMN